jgi:hypothetical protein
MFGDAELDAHHKILTFRHFLFLLSPSRYGDGPYYVQFTLMFEGQADTAQFMVEVSTRNSLPHSVFSFLTMVDFLVYDGIDFLSTKSVIHIGSNAEQLQAFGFTGNQALSLVEDSSEAPCGAYSVGFVGMGPQLKIIMTSDSSKHGSRACFGKVVAQGRQTLSRVQAAVRTGTNVEIMHVRQVDVQGNNKSDGEL